MTLNTSEGATTRASFAAARVDAHHRETKHADADHASSGALAALERGEDEVRKIPFRVISAAAFRVSDRVPHRARERRTSSRSRVFTVGDPVTASSAPQVTAARCRRSAADAFAFEVFFIAASIAINCSRYTRRARLETRATASESTEPRSTVFRAV